MSVSPHLFHASLPIFLRRPQALLALGVKLVPEAVTARAVCCSAVTGSVQAIRGAGAGAGRRGERPSCGIGAVAPAAPGTPGAGPAPGNGVIHGAVWILGQKELLLPGSSHESQLVSVWVITYNTFTNWDTQEMGT